MNNTEIGAIVHRELSQARGYDSDTLSNVRAKALKLYNGDMTAAPEGRVQVVSLDVADALHATLAQICPVVKSSQIEFEAISQDDEEQAQTETDFVKINIERSSGYDTLFVAMHDALLIGNGWLHVFVDEQIEVTEQIFPPNLPDEAVYALTTMVPDDTKVTLKAGKDKTIAKIEKTNRMLKIECVPPENMLYSENGSDATIDQCRFVARMRVYSASQLKEKGISDELINALPDYAADTDGYNARQGVFAHDGDEQAAQDANRLKRIYICFIRLAIGNGNRTELREIWVGENQGNVLLNEAADYIPFITGSAITMPHRITGTGFGQLLKDVQESKTHTLRAYLDNMTVLNGSRLGVVEGQVNMSDLTNGRINGIVRMRSPDSVVPLPSADIGPQCIGALGYLDTVMTQRVGSSLDFNEVQAQLMGTSATAASGQLAKVEQMGGWFATNIVNTLLLPLFMMTHRVLRTEMGGPTMAKISGKWAETDTSQWKPRMATDVHMGMTTVEKAERLQALNSMIMMQQTMMQQGGTGIITDLGRIYHAMGDWIRTSGLGSPDQYLLDPQSPESQQAIQAQQQQTQAAKEEEARLAAEEIKLTQNFELEKQRRDLDYKVWADKLDAEIEEAKLTTNGVIEIKKLAVGTKEDIDDE